MSSHRKRSDSVDSALARHSNREKQDTKGNFCDINQLCKTAKVAAKMNKRWICSDVWMDILPSFDRAELGLKMALLSDRFDVLVDTHFAGKSELTIWRPIMIRKDKEPKAKFFVIIDGKVVYLPWPDRSLPIKIRFKDIQIEYIDHFVIEFLRSNKQIWDKSGTALKLDVCSYKINEQQLWDVFVREIWPIFAKSIRQLGFNSGDDLDNLRRLKDISPKKKYNFSNVGSFTGEFFHKIFKFS